jgi:2-amino-4-hydroxy-6-hydroxymethyldihydropteridine diphosphokinase
LNAASAFQRDTLKTMHTAYIGLGANLPGPAGAPAQTLASAVVRIAAIARVRKLSSLYSTDPVGYSDQPKFVNAVLALETASSARELLEALLGIERELGRDRSHAIANGPRTLDLDILLFQDRVIDEPGLCVPHPRLAERAFVLMPLSEIASQTVDPRSGQTVAELLRNLLAARAVTAHSVVPMHAEAWDSLAEKLAAGN